MGLQEDILQMFKRCNAIISLFFSSRRPTAIYILNLLLLLVLGLLDYVTGDYSLIIFYMIPVSLAAWFIGKGSGLLFSILSYGTRLISDAASTSFMFNFSRMHYWNVFVEFIFLLIVSQLIAALKKKLEK